MQTFIYLFAIGLFLFSTGCSAQPKIGQTFPQWQQGELEIHHIYTGRGESNFLILPDGTSLLIDAGDWDPKDYPKMCDALPDSSRRAGEWIARYIKRVNPYQEQVDYLLISHFHNDHTGDSSNPVPMTEGRNPDYTNRYLTADIPIINIHYRFKTRMSTITALSSTGNASNSVFGKRHSK